MPDEQTRRTVRQSIARQNCVALTLRIERHIAERVLAAKSDGQDLPGQ